MITIYFKHTSCAPAQESPGSRRLQQKCLVDTSKYEMFYLMLVLFMQPVFCSSCMIFSVFAFFFIAFGKWLLMYDFL